MPASNVDLVLVVDSSQSMKNCFEQLRRHFASLTTPLQGHLSKVRFGLVALSAFKGTSGPSYRVGFVRGPWDGRLYAPEFTGSGTRDDFFTDKPAEINAALSGVVPKGNEDMLLALDIAADLPFGSLSNTKRVIALFSDERFERGVSACENHHLIPALREKLMARHIQLFAAIPEGPAANELAETDRSEVDFINGGEGLKNVDFSQLLAQMGKSISGSMIQAVSEPTYQRAIFGQDKWVRGEDGLYSTSIHTDEKVPLLPKVREETKHLPLEGERESPHFSEHTVVPTPLSHSYYVGQVFQDAPFAPQMVVIPSGSFLMGAAEDDELAPINVRSQHRVTFAYNLALGRFPITCEEFDAYDSRRGRGKGPAQLSWYMTNRYIEWLNRKLGIPKTAEIDIDCPVRQSGSAPAELVLLAANMGSLRPKNLRVWSD